MIKVCDFCLDVAYDNFGKYDIGIDGEDQDMVMRQLGDDLGDHLCEQVETDGEILCACACHDPYI